MQEFTSAYVTTRRLGAGGRLWTVVTVPETVVGVLAEELPDLLAPGPDRRWPSDSREDRWWTLAAIGALAGGAGLAATTYWHPTAADQPRPGALELRLAVDLPAAGARRLWAGPSLPATPPMALPGITYHRAKTADEPLVWLTDAVASAAHGSLADGDDEHLQLLPARMRATVRLTS